MMKIWINFRTKDTVLEERSIIGGVPLTLRDNSLALIRNVISFMAQRGHLIFILKSNIMVEIKPIERRLRNL
jgi:hypothetical protein